jgi:RNA polymerase-binding transcription factor DksA
VEPEEPDPGRLPSSVGPDVEPPADTVSVEQVEAELADVEAALRRLDEGTYGTCEVCGEQIDESRLTAHPATRFCAAHQPST